MGSPKRQFAPKPRRLVRSEVLAERERVRAEPKSPERSKALKKLGCQLAMIDALAPHLDGSDGNV